jgi:phosphoribosylamine-glycine ligase
LMLQAVKGELKDRVLKWRNGYSCDVVLVSGGYPGKYEKGKLINMPVNHGDDIAVYHSGTKIEGNTTVTSGGRVLNVVGLGSTLAGAIDTAYRHVEKINFENMFYRRDIGHRGLRALKKS